LERAATAAKELEKSSKSPIFFLLWLHSVCCAQWSIWSRRHEFSENSDEIDIKLA
jgi:hypothetical protein